MKINNNYSYNSVSLKQNFNTNVNKNNSQPIAPQPQKDTVSFSGSGIKKTVAKGIAGGIALGSVLGYWLGGATILHSVVPKTIDNGLAEKFEQKAVSAACFEDQKIKDELVNDVIKQIENKPNDEITKDYLGVLDKYEISSEYQQQIINDKVSEALDSGKVKNNSAEYYQDYINSKNQE